MHLFLTGERGVGKTTCIHQSKGSIVVMDELGFLESQSKAFCEKVLEVLGQEVTVLGVIKPKNLPFLNQVREHPKVLLYTLTEDNRQEQLEKCLKILR